MATLNKAPLDGIRVLDLGRYQAGPRCGLMFARMGAEVIKIEAISGDESRKNGPMVRGQSAYWVQYNSGKKSLALNMRAEEGKEVLRDLVKVSDVLLQNFRPGTIDVMGFGYRTLKSLNPRIVMVNVSAYGQYGPYKDRIGFDPIGQALGGMMSLTGFPGQPPTRTFFPLIDRITSLHATIGALAALREREFSGEGQAIDVALADTGFTANEIPIAAYLGNGAVEEREGNGQGLMNSYETADGWVFLSANNDSTWQRLCKALGKVEWEQDARFATKLDREKNATALEAELAQWFASRTSKEAADFLSDHGVPIAPVNTVEQAARDPHLHEREILVETPDPAAGRIHVAGKMIKFSRTPMVVGSAPSVGEHTAELLEGLLGYSRERVQELVDAKVVGAPQEATASGPST